jgi:hypothetical protein
MSHGPFWIRRPKPTRLAQLLDDQRSAPLTYPEVGATAGHLPSGYHSVREALVLGRGEDVFERAAEGIRAWAPQRAAGIDLVPPTPELAEGESLLLSFRSFSFHVTAACRVVYVVNEPDRYARSRAAMSSEGLPTYSTEQLWRTSPVVRSKITVQGLPRTTNAPMAFQASATKSKETDDEWVSVGSGLSSICSLSHTNDP